MKIKTIVNGRGYIDDEVNEFTKNVDVIDIQTHFASDQQVVVIIIYKEEMRNVR